MTKVSLDLNPLVLNLVNSTALYGGYSEYYDTVSVETMDTNGIPAGKYLELYFKSLLEVYQDFLFNYFDFGPIAHKKYQISPLSRNFEFPALYSKQLIQNYWS